MSRPDKFIITFANQKGGVGKSTLCTFFACYLHQIKNEVVRILDCDKQRSIAIARQTDAKAFANIKKDWPFEVYGYDLKTPKDAATMAQMLPGTDGFVLIDTPGWLMERNLGDVLLASDMVVCPFNYEPVIISSTCAFVSWFAQQKARTGSKAQLVMVPNNLNKSWGTAAEKKQWEQLKDHLQTSYGHITPAVQALGDIKRLSTLRMKTSHQAVTKSAFDDIWYLITGEEATNGVSDEEVGQISEKIISQTIKARNDNNEE